MQRFFLTSVSALSLAGLAQTAQAGPIDPDFGLHGHFAIGMLDPRDADRLDYFDFDVVARLLFTPLFGVAFGYEGLGEFNDDLLDRYTAYGFVNVSDDALVGFGYIPSPLENLTIDDRLGYAAPIELQFAVSLSDPFPVAIGYLDDEPPLGVLFEGQFGALWAGASVHVNQNGDGEVYSAALTHSGSLGNGVDYTAGGGVEFVSSSTADNLFRFFGLASFESDQFFGAVSFTSGESPIGGDLTVVDASVGYIPDIPPLAVSSAAAELAIGADFTLATQPGGGSDLRIYGVGAELTFENRFGVNLSAGQLDSGGGTSEWVALEASFTF